MRIAMAVTSFLALAIVAIALGVGSMGAGAATTSDDDYPPQDPQCGDQEGDDEDPWDVGPEDTPTGGATPDSIDVIAQPAEPAPSWDGDHDIEWDDCYITTQAPETATPSATPTPSPTPTTEPVAFTNGDANCDGNLNGTDAVTILLDISGSSGGSDCGSADADCSGSVDTADVSRVLGIVAGLDDSC